MVGLFLLYFHELPILGWLTIDIVDIVVNLSAPTLSVDNAEVLCKEVPCVVN